MSDNSRQSYYVQLDEHRFRPTAHTMGPWSATTQHMGPPAALMAGMLERDHPSEEMHPRRLSVEIFGPLGAGDMMVTTAVERSGRSVELLAADIESDGRTAARMRMWRMRGSDTADVAAGEVDPMPEPAAATEFRMPEGWVAGYIDSIEWRRIDGAEGSMRVWGRPRVPLLDTVQMTSLQNVMAVADSASGVSSRLDIREWLFINTELSVHLHRRPSGQWVGMDAHTVIGPDGSGTASSFLQDERGHIGRSAQALLVSPRDGSGR